MMSGKLYVVATPIGNLEDISARALRVLREVDLIAAEDTRHTGHLLTRFEIRKPLISYHQFSEAKRTSEFLQKFEQGQSIALVSDAGLPGMSDPGERLIRAAVDAGVPVEVVPGASAPLLALGGLRSAIFNEVLQFVLIWLGALLIPILGLIEAGGWSNLRQQIAIRTGSGAYTHLWSTLGSFSDNPMGIHWTGIVLGLAFVTSFGSGRQTSW